MRRAPALAIVTIVAVLAACTEQDDVASRSASSAPSSTTSSTVPAPRDTPCGDVVATPEPDDPQLSSDDVLAGLEQLGVAETVNPIDDSTSVVIEVDRADQIRCEARSPAFVSGVVHSTVTTSSGASLELRMDVLVPRGDGPWPLVVFVPGGGFATCDRTSSLAARTYVAQAGYVVASVEYRLIGQGIYQDGVDDVKAAIRYLRANAREFDLDPDRVAVWGESAGGYLAAMVGATSGGDASSVQAVIDFYGPSDLTAIAADFDTDARLRHLTPGIAEARYLHGADSGLTVLDRPEVAARANPVSYVDAGDPPFVFVHGRSDPLVSPSQTLLVHTALVAAGVDSTRFAVEGAGHAGDHFTTRAVMDFVLAFLARTL